MWDYPKVGTVTSSLLFEFDMRSMVVIPPCELFQSAVVDALDLIEAEAEPCVQTEADDIVI